MIREITKADIPHLKTVLDNCDLFPSEYLEPMIAPHLDLSAEGQIWFTYLIEDVPVAIAYCAPMELTNGTYNLYAIGIHNHYQHQGLGTQMMEYVENRLRTEGHRILIVETSSSVEQLPARNFYLKCGYTHEATLRDFWDEGDDKIVFWKNLKAN